MALTVGEREVRPITADEALRMVAAGIVREPHRLELLLGVFTEKPVKSPPHEEVKARLVEWLAPGAATARHRLRIESPIAASDGISLPEPDLAVVEAGDYGDGHPATALLVVEVAVSSMRVDTEVKSRLYAAAGVPEYWVVDVTHRRLLVSTQPSGDAYEDTAEVRPPAEVAPRHVEVAPLDLDALLAGLH